MEGATARGATFGPYVTLGPHVEVAAGAHLENSILMEGVRVGPQATVVGSILGPRVTVPAGRRVDGQVLGADAAA
jgi:NDP-sugar pyrophosphorylase family protein